jgi:hypothetical protein
MRLVCMAILGGYTSLFVLFKIKGAISKKAPKEEIVAAPSSSSDASGMPSLDSRKFYFFDFAICAVNITMV